MDTVLTDYSSGISEPTRRLIDSSSEWETFWRRINETRRPPPEPPTIDFDESVVVAAAMGGRPTGGYTIGIQAVARSGDTLYAEIRERSPGEGCGVTLATTQPVQAVRAPVSDVSVLVTVERDTTHHCG